MLISSKYSNKIDFSSYVKRRTSDIGRSARLRHQAEIASEDNQHKYEAAT